MTNGALNFSRESDGMIAFDAPQGLRVHVDLLEIGQGTIERIHETAPMYSGAVASKSDLLLLRAMTVVDRGSDGDVLDFQWLLTEVAESGHFPEINDEESECLLGAVKFCLGECARFVVAGIIGTSNVVAAARLMAL